MRVRRLAETPKVQVGMRHDASRHPLWSCPSAGSTDDLSSKTLSGLSWRPEVFRKGPNQTDTLDLVGRSIALSGSGRRRDGIGDALR